MYMIFILQVVIGFVIGGWIAKHIFNS